jgi:hypothetical protein
MMSKAPPRGMQTYVCNRSSLGPTTGSTVRNLAAPKPKVSATMHGSSFSGDGATALNALGDHYDVLLQRALADSQLG